MIRSTTSANAPYAMMLLSAAAGTAFQYRTTAANSPRASRQARRFAPPYWIRITRVGDVFARLSAADGSTWTPVAASRFPMVVVRWDGVSGQHHDQYTSIEGTFDVVVANSR